MPTDSTRLTQAAEVLPYASRRAGYPHGSLPPSPLSCGSSLYYESSYHSRPHTQPHGRALNHSTPPSFSYCSRRGGHAAPARGREARRIHPSSAGRCSRAFARCSTLPSPLGSSPSYYCPPTLPWRCTLFMRHSSRRSSLYSSRSRARAVQPTAHYPRMSPN